MGRWYKAFMVFMIISMVVAYVLGSVYIDDVYAKKIQDLERDILLYESRNKELYSEKTKLEMESFSLMAQLASEQEKANSVQPRAQLSQTPKVEQVEATNTTGQAPSVKSINQIQSNQQPAEISGSNQNNAGTGGRITRAS